MSLRSPTTITLSVLALALGAGVGAGACGHDRDPFTTAPQNFGGEPSPDAGHCGYQCSIDGRKVLDSCTGQVIVECSNDLACGAGTCQEPCAAAAADSRSTGCDFYFQAPPSSPQFGDACYAAFIVNSSTLAVDLTLERDGKKLDLSGAVYRTAVGSSSLEAHTGPLAAGESVIVFLSDRDPSLPDEPQVIRCPSGVKAAHYWSTPSNRGTSVGKSFRLETSTPVALSTIYPFGGAASFLPSATLVQPVVSWSKENVIINGWEAVTAGKPVAQIVAAEDDTKVTVYPRKDILGNSAIAGSPAGVPVSYTLGHGEFLQLTQTDELTGSFIVSDKPTSVFGGHQCADIPSTGAACDTLGQQIPSFEHWGSEYASAGYRPRAGDEQEPMPYRIVAARDGTRFEYEPTIPPGAPTELQAGESAYFPVTVGSGIVVRSQDTEHPFYLAAYMTGWLGGYFGSPSYGTAGDPEFVNVVPTGQYLGAYSFYADPTYAETSLVVIRQKTDGRFDDVELDCTGPIQGFRPLGSRGEFEYARVDLSIKGGNGLVTGDRTCTRGLHGMQSAGPFTATIWGWDRAASYAYPGGTAHRTLVETPLVSVH
ncbi:hypothetical protein AKJ09_03229 [Labilithrix luteola]|uniref:IgGFc-binding protein N-terminal domain-containing protein n=1 Tax=Labilithrix luteola TaxID=1391654 RepID=A0A0K1PSP7_9BACT|nr:IgGFc-binding protein [Labilithrix luteola]AKU96565.1 hypothetical protein AKJ09_03229 [Labilithrix luteola]